MLMRRVALLLASCAALQAPVRKTPSESRRRLAEKVIATGIGAALLVNSPALAQERAELRTYDDPLFEVTFPSDFFAIRRTIEGDVVRRGNVIFTAGRLGKAEVVTVEYFPVESLIEQANAQSFFPEKKIARWKDIGNAQALAEFICERRDNEAQMAAKGASIPARASSVLEGTLTVTDDVISAEVLTRLASKDMRVGEAGNQALSMGVTRHQATKYFLLPGGHAAMAVWASCLDDFWDEGEGVVLKDVVASLKPKVSGPPSSYY